MFHSNTPPKPKKRKICESINAAALEKMCKSALTAFQEAVDPDWIEDEAKDGKVIINESKFDIAAYILGEIIHHADGNSSQHNHFKDWADQYCKLAPQERHIGTKPLHTRARKDETELLVKKVLQRLLDVLNSFAEMPPSAKALAEMLKKIDVEDACAHDSTSLALRPGCDKYMDCKASGRDKKPRSGRETSHRNASAGKACALRAHTTTSVLKRSVPHVTVTESAESELKNVPYELLKRVLFLLDRGYDSRMLMSRIINSDNEFIVRLRTNHTYEIIRAFDAEGNRISLPQDFTLANLPEEYGAVDLDVRPGKNCPRSIRELRVTRSEAVPEDDDAEFPQDKKSSCMFLATSLPRDKVPYDAVFNLYTCRWQDEIIFKALKSNDSLSYFNCALPSLVLQNIYFSIAAYAVEAIILSICEQRAGVNLSEAEQENIATNKGYRNALPKETSVLKATSDLNIRPLLTAIYNRCSRSTLWRKLKDLVNQCLGLNRKLGGCVLREQSISPRDWGQGKDLRLQFIRIAVSIRKALRKTQGYNLPLAA